MKLNWLLADYTKKQKIASIVIGFTFALLFIVGMIYQSVFNEQSMDDNPLAFVDEPLIDRFFEMRDKGFKKNPPFSQRTLANLVLVKIDDECLGTDLFPQWPIPRGRYAELLEKMKTGGAKTIGFDIILDEKSPSDKDDAKLSKALAEMDNVFLPVYFYISSKKLDPGKIGKSDEESDLRAVKLPYKDFYKSLMKNVKEGDSRTGFVSFTLKDAARSTWLVDVVDKQPYYQLSLLLASHYMDIPQSSLSKQRDDENFMMGNTRIPMCKGQMRINYLLKPAPPSNMMTVEDAFNSSQLLTEFSIADVFSMTDDDLKAFFKDKIVLVGVTAEGGKDIKLTPFGNMPLVYAHANLILSFLDKKFLTVAPMRFNIMLILLAGILVGLLIPRFTPIPGAVLTGLMCYGYYQFSYWQFVEKSTLCYISAPIICVFLSFIVINIYHHVAESKAKAGMSRMFREFAPLPSSLIETYLEKSGGSAATGGRLAHVTVLFSDIRGYTEMSERMTSQEVMDLLSEYHSAMGEIFQKTGGVVFTYIGDAQLVVYGLEGESKINHAAASIKAGLMMQERLSIMAQKMQTENKPMFDVGVGICTGELSIGVVGSSQLKQYTVIGDTVNVASRIQGMSRELASPTLVHERTYLMAKHCIDAEALRPVKLKGKKELVNVYRAKKVNSITKYPGDEIKDLDREVEELHQAMNEARKKRQEENAEAASGREARKERTMRHRQRKEDSGSETGESESGAAAPDPFEPVEEKAKGEQVEEN
ncbi:MAG: adenylate/guanylate cyclase domain-containing protein [Firmicutes bacterium]|nr:adenylate/guanylate cyclase domain-containing protein [Bacillota bacterium]